MRTPFLFGNHHYHEILKGASLSLTLKVLAAALGFAFNLVLARRFGPEGAGLFGLAVTMSTMCAVLALMGLNYASVRLIAASAADLAWDRVRTISRAGLWIVLVSSAFLSCLVYLGRDFISIEIFAEPDLAVVLAFMAFVPVSLALRDLVSAYLRGLKRIFAALATEGLLHPTCALLVLLAVSGGGVERAGMGYLLGTGLAAAFGLLVWRSRVSRLPGAGRSEGGRRVSREMLVIGLPTLGVLLGDSVGQWSTVYILGIAADSRVVGLYRVAYQVAVLLGFLITASDTIMSPKISALYHAGDRAELARICRFTIGLLLLAGLPAVLVILVFSELILSIFGPEFEAGSTALRILVLGQLVNLATGSAGTLLIMTGYERVSLLNALAGAVIVVVLSLSLIPHYGAAGAATAFALTMAFRNLSAVWLTWRHVGINVFTGRVRPGLEQGQGRPDRP